MKNLNFLLFLITFFPSFVFVQFNQTSIASGILFISFIIILFGVYNLKLIYFNTNIIKILSFINVFIVFHSILVYFLIHPIDFYRFFGTLLIFNVVFFTTNLIKIYFFKFFDYNEIFVAAIKWMYYIFIFFGFTTLIFNFSFTAKYSILNRQAFPFLEPSHFSLVFSPFLLFVVIIENSFMKKIVCLLSVVLILFFTKNLTLLIILIVSILISFPIRKFKHFFLGLLLVIPIFISGISYYSSRIFNTDNNQNLSNLVWLQGWENSYLNLVNTYGLGVGFQQFGVNGLKGKFAEIISNIVSNVNLDTLNKFDGGTLGAKIIGEFGLFGLLLIFYFLRSIYISFKFIKNFQSSNYLILFSHCIRFSLLFELFFRSMSYISSTTFLYILSFIFIYEYSVKYDRHLRVYGSG